MGWTPFGGHYRGCSSLGEPARKRADRNPEQLGQRLLRCGENLSRTGKYVAHGIADLLERDANAATLLPGVVMAKRFFRREPPPPAVS